MSKKSKIKDFHTFSVHFKLTTFNKIIFKIYQKKMKGINYLFGIIVFILFFSSSYAFITEISGGGKDCVYEIFDAGKSVNVFFEVLYGGNEEIDVFIFDPMRKEIYSQTKQKDGMYTFITSIVGKYKFCFYNTHSNDRKGISFDIASALDTSSFAAKPDHVTPVENAVLQLSTTIHQIYEEQKYFRKKEEIHRDLSEDILDKIRYWGVFENFLLIATSLAQMFFIKRLFEVRRNF
eukprot:TRINITY_DN6368_c0_g1_i1.p1 TRINITY_DN6368_c0_g1~~TRINITY_DN6368_c0_g1_i1.p1  ORF type:complete len:235 (-),score=34.50 TRINITY_DN6368_c0_g1_i1:82-786(-)